MDREANARFEQLIQMYNVQAVQTGSDPFHAGRGHDVSDLLRMAVGGPHYEAITAHLTWTCPVCGCHVLPGGEDRHYRLHRR